MSKIGDFISKNAGDLITGGLSSVASMATGLISNAINMSNQRKLQNEQNSFNAQQAQISREWNEQMDNTKYQRQVADMQAAGVNPALAMNGGVTTQATSNATAQAAQVSAPKLDLTSAVQMAMQAKQLKLQEKSVNAQVKNTDADTKGKEIDNSYRNEFNELRNKGMQMAIDLTDSQKQEIKHRISNIDASTEKLKKEADTEVERKNLVVAEGILKSVNAYQIITMLPYEQAYREAQTEETKTRAALNLVQCLYQEKLLDSGYIESMVRSNNANASEKEVKAISTEIENALSTGTWYNDEGVLNRGANVMLSTSKAVGGILHNLIGGIISFH